MLGREDVGDDGCGRGGGWDDDDDGALWGCNLFEQLRWVLVCFEIPSAQFSCLFILLCGLFGERAHRQRPSGIGSDVWM